MKKLKIYLSHDAYYVRLNNDELEFNQKKGFFKKWIENHNGQIPYYFLTFNDVERSLSSGSRVVNKLGLTGAKLYSHNPFEINSISGNPLITEKVISNNHRELVFILEKGQSKSLNRNHIYYTPENKPEINKISFHIDESSCNLNEKIYLSDNSVQMSRFHLISKIAYLDKPDYLDFKI